MKKEFLQQHFQKSGFDAMQSEALAAYFDLFRSEAATKHDVDILRAEIKSELRTEIGALRSELMSEIAGARSELKSDIASVRADLKSDIAGLRSDLKSEMGGLTAELTWRFIALVVFLATVTSLVGIFAS